MREQTDLVLVKPGGRLELFGGLASTLSGFAPPLDVGLIASFVKQHGFTVTVIDADAELLTPKETASRIAEHNPILVGIFAHTIRMTHAGKTLKILKREMPHVKTLLGGRHPSALPERTLRDEVVDFVCQGEAFYPLIELLDLLKSCHSTTDYRINGIWYLEDNRIRANSPAPLFNNLDGLPFGAWDLLPMEKYRAHNWHCFGNLERRQPYAIIYTSLGCPFRCTYCCVNAVYGRPSIRYRSPRKVVQELDYLVENFHVRNIRIADDIFTMKSEYVIDFCNSVIQRGYDLNMWCYARVDTVNEFMLERMKQAGINWISYGIEAGHKKVREGVFKRVESDVIERAVNITRAAGISIIANFIFGLPDDNLDTMQETLNMSKEFNFEYVNFYVAMAWPGSKLYDDAIKNGVQLPESWEGYAQLSEEALPLPTKHLSSKEVLRFRDKAFEEYFSNPCYIEMITRKFGIETAESIKGMLRHKIHRKFA